MGIDLFNALCILTEMEFKSPVSDLRARLKLSQDALGKLLGVDQGTVSRMERGLAAIDRRTQLAMRQIAADASIDLPPNFFDESAQSVPPTLAAASPPPQEAA